MNITIYNIISVTQIWNRTIRIRYRKFDLDFYTIFLLLIRLHPRYGTGWLRAKVHEHTLAQRQARQVKGKAGLKWNTGKLYYSTVELGYQHTL